MAFLQRALSLARHCLLVTSNVLLLLRSFAVDHRWSSASRRHFSRTVRHIAITAPGLLVGLGATAAFIIVLIALMRDIGDTSIIIEPISVPKNLTDKGYTPTVAAQELRDAINTFVSGAKTPTAKGESISLKGERLDIVVPTVGLSLDQITEAIESFLNLRQRQSISGEFTETGEGITLRLRSDGSVKVFKGSLADIDVIYKEAAHDIILSAEPYYVAATLYLQHNLSQSLEEIDSIIARFPSSDQNVIQSYSLRGAILLEKRQYAEAIEAETTASILDPHSATPHNNLGAILNEEGKREEAIVEYRKAISLDRSYPYTYVQLGNLFFSEGKRDDAIAEYRAAIALDRHFAAPHFNLANALRVEGKWNEAIAEYRLYSILGLPNATPHYAIATLERGEGKYDEAIAEYRIAIHLAPNNPVVHNDLGAVFFEEHNLDAAILEYRTAIRLNSQSATPRANLAQALERQARSTRSSRVAISRIEEACYEVLIAHRLEPTLRNANALISTIEQELGHGRSCR